MTKPPVATAGISDSYGVCNMLADAEEAAHNGENSDRETNATSRGVDDVNGTIQSIPITRRY